MIERVSRSTTLLRLFVVLSALILGAGGLVLGSLVASAIRSQAVDDREASLTQYVDGVLGRELVHGDRLAVQRQPSQAALKRLHRRDDILSVKVWRADGMLAWTDTDPDRIGRHFAVSHHLEEALDGNGEAELEDLGEGGEEEEHEGEVKAGITRALEVYAPVRSDDGARIVGALEVYADARPLESAISGRRKEIWLVIGLVFLGLCGAFALLARQASNTLRRQTRMLKEHSAALAESYDALERSTLDAIETLNATVEAKDPYTAGHSARVQRVALALGRELGLGDEELEALRLGGLFHDIGKIAIPDAILLKPALLTEDEFERMKEHSAEGARIVGKLGSLRPIVPLIRHHHERWDGRGYPDGQAGEDIPLLAAIVGLADAWDAMTTERPYAAAMSAQDALEEIRRGSGGQFAPAVAQAMLRVCERDPADFGLQTHHAAV
jgi:putative nucleotidyltransferase with HDIG domain